MEEFLYMALKTANYVFKCPLIYIHFSDIFET